MISTFDRPIGVSADVTELEYISALHQTDVTGGIRKDGPIKDVDISLFLSSRYGVVQTPKQVRENILSGVNSPHQQEGILDMMQLVSLLMIPKLREQNQEELLTFTLEMMLHDVTGSREAKPLTRTLIRQIFHAYGETELAQDDELVDAMLLEAGGRGVILNVDTFHRALTNDVIVYDPSRQTKFSTNLQDVLASSDVLDKVPPQGAQVVPAHDDAKTTREIPFVYSASNMDGVAETFRSRPLLVFQWTFFVLSFQTYLLQHLDVNFLPSCGKYYYQYSAAQNFRWFVCRLGVSVTRWILVMVVMSIVGVLYYGTVGIGNFIEVKNPLYPLFGALATVAFTALPLYVYEDTSDQVHREFLEYTTLALGGCVVLLNLWQVITLLIPKGCRLYRSLESILVPEAIRTETRNKQAAAYKIDHMVKNALEIHKAEKQDTVVPTHFGQALLNFAQHEPESQTIFGFRWTWRMITSRELFCREGVIFSGRLLSINFTQFLTTIFILIGGIVITFAAADSFQQQIDNVDQVFQSLVEADVDAALARAITNNVVSETSTFLAASLSEACPVVSDDTPSCNDATDIFECIPSDSTALCTLVDYTIGNEQVLVKIQTELLNAAGFNTIGVFDKSFENLVNAAEEATDSIYPAEQNMVVIPLAIGTIFAFITALSISLILLPSATSTIMKLRSGLIPFARYPKVLTWRIAPDQTAHLRGVMFWGCIFASVLMGAVIAFIAFLFLWQVTAAWALLVLASIVGTAISTAFCPRSTICCYSPNFNFLVSQVHCWSWLFTECLLCSCAGKRRWHIIVADQRQRTLVY